MIFFDVLKCDSTYNWEKKLLIIVNVLKFLHMVSHVRPNPIADCFQYHVCGRKGLVMLSRFLSASEMQKVTRIVLLSRYGGRVPCSKRDNSQCSIAPDCGYKLYHKLYPVTLTQSHVTIANQIVAHKSYRASPDPSFPVRVIESNLHWGWLVSPSTTLTRRAGESVVTLTF